MGIQTTITNIQNELTLNRRHIVAYGITLFIIYINIQFKK